MVSLQRVKGTINHISRRKEVGDNVNDDIVVTMSVSLIRPQNFDVNKLAFIEYQGVRWKINTVEFKPPRVELHFGGVYRDKSGST